MDIIHVFKTKCLIIQLIEPGFKGIKRQCSPAVLLHCCFSSAVEWTAVQAQLSGTFFFSSAALKTPDSSAAREESCPSKTILSKTLQKSLPRIDNIPAKLVSFNEGGGGGGCKSDAEHSPRAASMQVVSQAYDER